jgi:pimeloyl-ACP methyl ester carboxylesterase
MSKNIAAKGIKNYVFIHGAWHGSWCWQRITPMLQKFGHKAVAPDLPGHGYNKEDFKNITLSTYVDHITDLVKASTHPVVLVGHSMAGVVISQVAENVPDKISCLVYTSAFIPDNNGSLLDEEKKANNPSVALEVVINERECSISLKPEHIKELFFGKCKEQDVKYALSQLQKQPLLPFVSKASLTAEKFGVVPKFYIECLQDRAINIEDQRRMHSKVNCEVVSIDTDHSPFFSAENELVSILESITSSHL